MAEITNRTGLVLTLPFAICEINLLQQICVQLGIYTVMCACKALLLHCSTLWLITNSWLGIWSVSLSVHKE